MTLDDLRADVEAAVFALESQPSADLGEAASAVELVRSGRVRELQPGALRRTLEILYPLLGWPAVELARYGPLDWQSTSAPIG